MMRVLFTASLLLIAATAFASYGEMTPQQVMDQMMNCPVCSAWGAEPALGPTIRHSISTTATGYVETMATANESLKPAFDKCAAECQKRCAGIATMSKEQKAKLCTYCQGQMKLMERKDLSFENVGTPLGIVTVATSSSPDGVKALHSFAAMAQKQCELMAQAGKEMQQGTMKSKM